MVNATLIVHTYIYIYEKVQNELTLKVNRFYDIMEFLKEKCLVSSFKEYYVAIPVYSRIEFYSIYQYI